MSTTVIGPTPPSRAFSIAARVFNYIALAALHLGTIYAFWRSFSPGWVALAVFFYVVRMLAITGGYHRYFSHRTFKTSRAFQLFMALVGTATAQKGPLWWAAVHRIHHKHSDSELDVHSPTRRGFWYAHMGWVLSTEHEAVRYEQVGDLAKYPELVFVDRYHWIGIALHIALVSAFGLDAFLWGYVVSTCFLLHGTFTINSLSHLFGTRRYETTDTSRNNLWLALITLGEGWHNNHHHYQSSCRQGFYWYEIDVTYYVIKALSWVGLVWDVREPPQRVLDEGRRGEVAPTPAE